VHHEDIRYEQLIQWLDKQFEQQPIDVSTASADASFRRYFRVNAHNSTYIVMDAPPDKEPISAFIAAAQALAAQQVHVPQIHAYSEQAGFILMEDLGNVDYLSVLADAPHQWYSWALQSLLRIQRGIFDQPNLELPLYDAAHLEMELDVFVQWYVQTHLQKSLDAEQTSVWAATKATLIKGCQEQPQVWVHRDYHCRNLMATTDQPPGVIDFQDLLIGPIAYDVVSLLKDCYIEWPRTKQIQWCEEYLAGALDCGLIENIDIDRFTRWFDLTGLQRHLKVLGVFSRLHHRDGKSQYLDDLPLVRSYVSDTLDRYPELQDFKQLFDGLPHA
jgi:aminoglycoside/choline kinase family phosphotransferase